MKREKRERERERGRIENDREFDRETREKRGGGSGVEIWWYYKEKCRGRVLGEAGKRLLEAVASNQCVEGKMRGRRRREAQR